MKITIIIFTFLFSCAASRQRKSCIDWTRDMKPLNISNFNDLYDHMKIDTIKVDDILWIVDGSPISCDSIISKIDNKDYEILKVDKLSRSQLFHIYSNKNWALAALIKTNNCLNK